MNFAKQECLPGPIIVDCRVGSLDDLLAKEWLLTNSLGSYASSSAAACNTRRYHGLLIASTTPPVGRLMALSSVMEQLTADQITYELATNEFPGTFSPRGVVHLDEFRSGVGVSFIYHAGKLELRKEILLADAANALVIRYTLTGGSARLKVWPFAGLRDFHGLRKVTEPHQMTYQVIDGGVSIQDRMRPALPLCVTSAQARFDARPQWWYKFFYRADAARGQDAQEDLYTPGGFVFDLADSRGVELTATLGEPQQLVFQDQYDRRRRRLNDLVAAVDKPEEPIRRLAAATDQFVVQRHFPAAPPTTTILAGYHWFADWGRDTFISLPGLLLCTKRFEQARQVFRTFAGAISHGLVPNRFDDYSTTAHYNSMDGSLWFITAAERYIQASGDRAFWQQVLMPACHSILKAFGEGTLFDIRADADGLLSGGSHNTQLTWMDAAIGGEVITPRHGKAVEINALWYNAHRIMADRCRGIDNAMAAHYGHLADLIGPAFVRTFWNAEAGWLYDCISSGWPDASLRPNQIFAVSLPHSPLDRPKQRAVVDVVQQKLLTPMGLRTLSQDDCRYRGAYAGSWDSRDRAYHQGTVWAWLAGPFIEAYLKVNDNSPGAIEQARAWLASFDAHLLTAGLGSISEIFDGESPHAPAGCIAQAWSVAEVLRAKMLVG